MAVSADLSDSDFSGKSEGIPLAQRDFILTVTNSLGEGLCVLDESGRIVFLNPAAAKILGEREADLRGENLYSMLYLPEGSGRLDLADGHPLRKVINLGLPIRDEEAVFKRPDGNLVFVSYTATLAQSAEQFKYTLFIFHDITEHKAAESKLRERERQLAVAQTITKIGSWEWDLVHDESTWTDQLYRILGYEPGEIQPSFELAMAHVHPEDRPRARQIVLEAREQQRPYSYTARFIRTDGKVRLLEVHGMMRLGPEGELVRMWGTAQDVTDRHLAEQALRRSEERFRTLFEAADIGILLLELDGVILQANPALQRLTGYRTQDVEQMGFEELIWAPDISTHSKLFDALRRGERDSYQCELRCCRQDDQPVWVNLIVSLLRRSDGQPLRAIAMVEDISQRKAIEAELAELKRRLGRSRENERIRFAQEVHDGPIQDLYAAAYQLQALKHLDLNARQKHLVEVVQEQFQQVNDTLRALCRELRPPALATFGLESAIRSHAERFQKLYPDVTVTLDLASDGQALPEYVRLTLFRICQEVLSNVAKHAQATRVLIRFILTDAEIMLEIQDNGEGFEVPERWIDLARKGHLGLVGASERAEEIDGRLLILSTPGLGTIVRVSAPRPAGEETEKVL